MQQLEDEAVECVRKFFADDAQGYAGLSCGKDSCVIFGILRTLRARHNVRVPIVYVREVTYENPDNTLVLDALKVWGDITIDIIDVDINDDVSLRIGSKSTGRIGDGFKIASQRYGDRYVSGIRADESRGRALRCAYFGTTTARTCAPLAEWNGDDVFAYLHRESLPVHPAYACTFGGRIERRLIRVATLGGERGTGHGRRDWEKHYYALEMRGLGYGCL